MPNHIDTWVWAALWLVAFGVGCLVVLYILEAMSTGQETEIIRNFEAVSDRVYVGRDDFNVGDSGLGDECGHYEHQDHNQEQHNAWQALQMQDRIVAARAQEEAQRQFELDWGEENNQDGGTQPWLDPLHPWYEGH